MSLASFTPFLLLLFGWFLALLLWWGLGAAIMGLRKMKMRRKSR
jgi:hypothetical protein